jgi:hypothetical protein
MALVMKIRGKSLLPGMPPEIIVILFGSGITVWTFLKGIPDAWSPFFAASLGLLITMCGIISVLHRHVLSDFKKDILSRMDWLWTFEPKSSWKLAVQIVTKTATQNGLECYETSSVANDDRYEDSVKNLAHAWKQLVDDKRRVFTRIFCFNDSSKDEQDMKCRRLFHQILSPEYDQENQYTSVRDCIRMGKIRILHLNYRLLTDFLIVRTEKDEYDCLMSFAPPRMKIFLISSRIRDKDVGASLFHHLEYVMSLAIDNCKENADSRNHTLSCSYYEFDQKKNTLIPK